VTLYLPQGTPTLKVGYGQLPAGVFALTDSAGRWAVDAGRESFDPTTVAIDDAKLVRIEAYGGAKVGTKDKAAVQAARLAWRERWERRAQELTTECAAAIASAADENAVAGPGATAALRAMANERGARDLVALAHLIGMEIPGDVAKILEEHGSWIHDRALATIHRWLAGFDEAAGGELLTAVAASAALKLGTVEQRVQEELQAAIASIGKAKVPWRTKPAKAAEGQGRGEGAAHRPLQERRREGHALEHEEGGSATALAVTKSARELRPRRRGARRCARERRRRRARRR
jgi:hypothetical protein